MSRDEILHDREAKVRAGGLALAPEAVEGVLGGFRGHATAGVHGPDGEQPIMDLSDAEALELMSHVPNVEASDPRPFTVAGLEGVQADLHANVEMTQIFGGAAGDFAMEPGFDVRLGVVELDFGLLMVMFFGPDGDLEGGCADGQVIIDSMKMARN